MRAASPPALLGPSRRLSPGGAREFPETAMPTPRTLTALPLTDSEAAFAATLARAARARRDKPLQLASFLAGLVVDGSLHKPGVRTALAPYMKLPKPEPLTHVRARMALLIANRVSADGNVTRDDLTGAGFTRAEIDTHFAAAARAARVAEMAV